VSEWTLLAVFHGGASAARASAVHWHGTTPGPGVHWWPAADSLHSGPLRDRLVPETETSRRQRTTSTGAPRRRWMSRSSPGTVRQTPGQNSIIAYSSLTVQSLAILRNQKLSELLNLMDNGVAIYRIQTCKVKGLVFATALLIQVRLVTRSALCNLQSSSWLAWANDTAAQRTMRPFIIARISEKLDPLLHPPSFLPCWKIVEKSYENFYPKVQTLGLKM